MSSANEPAQNLFDALKNSQPIAFMASLSFIIAALVIRVGEGQSAIYNAAVTAAIMFLIAFILSLVRQTSFGVTRTDELTMINFGTYFFIFLGVVYWIVVAYEFSKQLNSINIILGTYLTAFFGSSAIYAAIRSYQKRQPKSALKKLSNIVRVIGGAMILFLSAWLIVPTIGISVELVPIWIPVWGAFVGSIAIGFSSIVHFRELKSLRKSAGAPI